mmetsp:Transcript_19145/g.49103  ORF Transcript_19145/g.49103 Transcript_19145/m.49103 type:complete len:211 (+) Transcript_19145:570-1202(+)
MAADDRDGDLIHRRACDLVHELLRADTVQRAHAHDLGRVQALLLPQLSHGRHNRVHRVDDEADNGLRAELGASLNDVLGDAGVDVKQVLAVLAGLARHARGHQDKVAAGQALARHIDGLRLLVEGVRLDLRLLVHVREVRRDALRGDHGNGQVVDAQLSHVRVHRHEHAQRLANAARTAHDAHLEVARHVCAEEVLREMERSDAGSPIQT